jgi:hypothetical protein
MGVGRLRRAPPSGASVGRLRRAPPSGASLVGASRSTLCRPSVQFFGLVSIATLIRLLVIDLRVQGADVGQIAVALVVVEPIADDELVGDVEPDEVDAEIGTHRVGLAQ